MVSRQGLTDLVGDDDLGGTDIAGFGLLKEFAEEANHFLFRDGIAKELEHAGTRPGVRISWASGIAQRMTAIHQLSQLAKQPPIGP
jgi:hypothetical protein